MKTYCIEESGKGLIGHWYWLMVAALPKIPEFGKEKIQLCFKDERYPIFLIETFDILKAKIELVPYTSDHIYIESIKPNFVSNDSEIPFIDEDVILFLRDLFLSSIENIEIKGYDKIYIRRNMSHLSLGNELDTACKNIRRRQILNEDELVEKLKELDFKILNLEKYHTMDKLRIFYSTSVILGPNGGGMCHNFVSRPGTKYIEILPQNPHQYIDQYKCISKYLNLEFHRFQDVIKEDHLDNMSVNIDSLITYLNTILS